MTVRRSIDIEPRRFVQVTALVVVLVVTVACASHVRMPLAPFYEPAELDSDRVDVRLDVPYRDDPSLASEKNRLDLYLPREPGWPLLAFVHGGSLEKGDTGMRVGGHDIYRNIGRFYSARGIGVALINYRLQPDVFWPDQVEDVAAATAWLVEQVPRLGGDGTVYLSGHSAGAWLAAHAAFDEDVRSRYGLATDAITGVISVSGSGFDLTDEQTWEMFGRRKKWERRFSQDPPVADWKERASVVPLIDGDARPPVLLMYSEREWPALARQNRLFCDALEAAARHCEIAPIDGLGHRRMVLALSRDDGPPARRILEELGALASGEGGESASLAHSSK